MKRVNFISDLLKIIFSELRPLFYQCLRLFALNIWNKSVCTLKVIWRDDTTQWSAITDHGQWYSDFIFITSCLCFFLFAVRLFFFICLFFFFFFSRMLQWSETSSKCSELTYLNNAERWTNKMLNFSGFVISGQWYHIHRYTAGISFEWILAIRLYSLFSFIWNESHIGQIVWSSME